MRGRHDPGGAVNVEAHVLGRVEPGLPRVDPDRIPIGPARNPAIASDTASTAACADANA